MPNNCSASSTCVTPLESQHCNLFYIREIASQHQTRSIQIYHKSTSNTTQLKDSSCATACDDTKTHIQYQNYCIPRVLMKDFLSFDQFRQPQNYGDGNAYEGMEFLYFFCHSMKIASACEHLANLCVLSMYNLDRYSPCNLFFSTQTTIMSGGDGGFNQKTVPFLFLTKGKSSTDELEKVIDNRYGFDREEYGEVRF